MDAIAGEKLKDLFTFEKWQDLFGTLPDTFGFTLSIYTENGTPIFVSRGGDPFCDRLRSVSPEVSAQCNASCHLDIFRITSSGKPEIFKCYAKIMNFALPLEYRGEKAVIFGQGSFANYEDFREFMNLVSSYDEEPISLSMPLVFTTPHQAMKVQSFVADSVKRLLKNSLESVTLRRKLEGLKSILNGWSDAAGQHPDDLYREMLGKLSTLLDIECITILTHDRQREQYAGYYNLPNRGRQAEVLSIHERDTLVQDLRRGAPFVLSAEPVSDPRADFLYGRGALYFFPVMANGKLEAILRIEDRALDESDIQIITGFCKRAALSIENHGIRQDLHKKFDRFAALSELAKAITPIQNDKTLLKMILEKSAELLKAEQGSLMLLDRDTDVLLVQARKGIADGVTEKVRIGRGEGIAGKVVEFGEPFLVEDLENDPRIKQKNRKRYKTRSFVSVPLRIDGRVIGVLNLADKDGGEPFNEEDLKLIQSFANQAAVVMERNIFLNKTEELKKLIITDDLTGLLNRRYLYERLKDEVARSERHGHGLSLLMLDLDGFKHCNDTYGHLTGDKTLKDIAETLLNTVRSMDVVARFGGDEFMVILPETGESIAVDIAERLRRNVAKKAGLNRKSGAPAVCSVTTSIGIACYPDHGKTSELLLQNVDLALYRAKNKGKNSIEVFS